MCQIASLPAPDFYSTTNIGTLCVKPTRFGFGLHVSEPKKRTSPRANLQTGKNVTTINTQRSAISNAEKTPTLNTQETLLARILRGVRAFEALRTREPSALSAAAASDARAGDVIRKTAVLESIVQDLGAGRERGREVH